MDYVSQLYFDDKQMNTLYASLTEYKERGPADRANADDSLFRNQGGSQMIVEMEYSPTNLTNGGMGYKASVAIVVESSDRLL